MKEAPTIYTLCLNPSLDKSVIIKKILFDDINRIARFQEDPGGKGINVSRVISFLGGATLSLGFSGGATGKRIEELLSKKKVRFSFTKIKKETRLILNVFEERTKKTIRLNEQGPKVKKEDIKKLLSFIFSLPYQKNDYFVCSGSPTKGISSDIYQKIIKKLNKIGVRTVLDSDNKPLELGIKSAPFLIKPNLWELSRLFKKNVQTVPEIILASKTLLKKGIKIAITSLGEKGAILVSKEWVFSATPPQIKVKSTIGSGDALLAGFLFSLTKGKNLKEALKFGVALGTATALQPGTAICQKRDISEILKKVKIKGY